MSAESKRAREFGQLEEGLLQAGDWYLWGPYLSERQWATVREDYSPDGAVWESFRTTTLAHALTAGAKTVWQASATWSSGSAWPSRCGTGGTPS